MSKELEALEILNDTARFADCYGNVDKQAYFILKEALKRNEPMKVLAEKHYVGFGYFKCPKCGVTISPLKIAEARYNYCPDCEKALDWSDDEKTN